MVEREARCLALEQAYVHEVYHQMGGGDHRQHPPWPRVTQFLNQLEPGSIVCDVGCGNGKYLNVNPSVFKVGVDRCSTLTETAKEEQNEVLVCDNLSLPFRDESFDAVLSIAVIHHFATTERRVGAIKELARVLRIGGRLVITAWAMEQRHRKFESQDVLVPWHRPQTLSTPSLELTPTTTTSEEDSHHHLYAACIHTSDSDSCHSARMNNGRRRSKGKLKEVVPSSSSSSLSSPNESCYSFVRRALKKLAGVKRSGTRHRPWFLESWSACSWKEPPPRRYDPEGCEDIQDLPIELRRLDDDQDLPLKLFPLPQQSFSKSDHNVDSSIAQKSKSLTDIMATDHKSIVRSQSSVPSLELHDSNGWNGNSLPVQKPRLVKQKQSMCCDEDVESEERDKATEMSDLIKSLPEFKVSGFGLSKRGNVFKQSSMNEELLSAERLREKERVRQNIQKQASLNEELIYNRNNKTFDSLRDTLFSTSTAKRFKLIKNGLTNKIKSSTTGIEKVSGASIKNGFVRILQGWTSSDLGMPSTQATSSATASPQNIAELKSTHSCDGKKEVHERRHSREDGSDSSKDSSLQSDTSVDSEDSFASVIFVPKSDQLEEQSTNTSPTLQSTPASPQPTSPKIKFPPPISPKMKSSSQISFALASYPSSPKMKHPGQLMSSTTPTSPKIKYFPQPTSPRPFQTAFLASSNRSSFKAQQSPNGTSSYPNQICKAQLVATKSLPTHCIPLLVPTRPPAASDSRDSTLTPSSLTSGGPSSDGSADLEQFDFSPAPPSVVPRDAGDESVDYTDFKPSTTPGVSPTAVMRPDEVSEAGSGSDVGVVPAQLPVETKPQIEDNSAVKKRNVMRTQFPLVRSMYSSTDTPPSRSVPRLLLLEIFNPETDDMDSDSSGLSSPDSVGSVISIKAEEEKPAESLGTENQSNTMVVVDRTSGVGAELRSFRGDNAEECSRLMLELKEPYGACNALSTRLSPLLEAAVDVATSLEETVDAVIQSSPQAKRRQVLQKSDPRLVKLQADLLTPNYKGEPSSSDESLKDRKHIQLDLNKSVDTKTKMASYSNDLDDNPDKRWDEECRQHLADFAEKLSEKLLAEIDRYREQSTAAKPLSPVLCGESQVMDQSQDPYLCKLSEDLQDLTKLSIELQDVPKLQPELTFNEVVDDSTAVKRIKGEGAAVEEPLVENCKKKPDHSEDLSTYFLMEDQIPLLHEYAEEIHTRNLISTFTESGSFDTSAEKKKKTEVNAKEEQQCSDKESSAELSDPESTESDGNWADSRRNTILPNSKALLVKPQVLPSFPALTYKEGTKIELLPAKDMPRRPSISVEMTEPIMDFIQREKDEVMFDGGQLHLGVSVESSEAGDISERTGSSSEGSRPSSRRETIQISDSGSVLSLRPGLSVESSEAGDYSDRAGSDGSRESRRDNASMGDITSGSQCSLLRPGNSVESSDTGDVSERTSSDVSRQNTSSAGKTPSTASFTSDKASDCSKDARFADRRMARCDGRSSSEEMPVPRTSMNKLVRQRASTQEPSELLVKAQSYETSISGSTSQDSLLSDSGGGAITFHRYYHVFREGELDQLIERYVENLHIISSYYDHANWCVVAEKVQVWTI